MAINMESADIAGFIRSAMKLDQTLCNEIFSKIGPNVHFGFIHGTINHPALARRFLCCPLGKKYYDLKLALKTISNSDILVCIKQLDSYIIFKRIEDYQRFLTQIHSDFDMFEGTGDKLNYVNEYTSYQIVLSNHEQKMAFIFQGDNDELKKVLKQCKETFDAEACVIEGENNTKEVTVQLMTENLAESKRKIDQLKSDLANNNRNFNEMTIQAPFERGEDDGKYVKLLLSSDDKQLFSSVKTINIVYGNIYNANGNISTNVNCNNVTNNVTNYDYRTVKTRNWISRQTIDANTSTKKTYDDYSTHMKEEDLIPINREKFSNIIKEIHGYKSVKNTKDNKHYYEKIDA